MNTTKHKSKHSYLSEILTSQNSFQMIKMVAVMLPAFYEPLTTTLNWDVKGEFPPLPQRL